MLKRYKWKLLFSSLAIFLPSVFALIFWDRLPQSIPTHFGADGVADSASGRLFAFFGIPAILFIFHLLCLLATKLDRKNQNRNEKMFALVFWIIPVLSCFVCGTMALVSLGKEVSFDFWMSVLFGILFVAIGNLLPKCQQNATMGIKIKHTLESEENWNATHRFAGKLWFAVGILVLFCAFLPSHVFYYSFLALVTLAVLLPVIYSHLFYRKQKKEGTLKIHKVELFGKMPRWARVVMILILILILCMVLFVMFTGKIEASLEKNALCVNADFYDDLTLEYQKISSVEWIEDFDSGFRKMGFASARLSMGTFESKALGLYTLYGETGADCGVLIRVDDEKLVIAYRDGENNRLLYEKLLEKIKAEETE